MPLFLLRREPSAEWLLEKPAVLSLLSRRSEAIYLDKECKSSYPSWLRLPFYRETSKLFPALHPMQGRCHHVRGKVTVGQGAPWGPPRLSNFHTHTQRHAHTHARTHASTLEHTSCRVRVQGVATVGEGGRQSGGLPSIYKPSQCLVFIEEKTGERGGTSAWVPRVSVASTAKNTGPGSCGLL